MAMRLDFVLTRGLVLAGSLWITGRPVPMVQLLGALSLSPAWGQGSVSALTGCWDAGAQFSCPAGVSPPPLKGSRGNVCPQGRG